MITREHLRLDLAIRYSWKIMVFSAICWTIAFALHQFPGMPRVVIPVAVVAILGTALAIILGFRNSSSYDRWWEARKIWGGIVNDSRSLTRQVMTFPAGDHGGSVPEEARELVRMQLAWNNALKFQLRERRDPEQWARMVLAYLPEKIHDAVMGHANRVTRIGLEQGRNIRRWLAEGRIDVFLFAQLDDTLTRLTDLQGRAERIKSTPLPKHYDYYTLGFLDLFVFFFPFGMMAPENSLSMKLILLPVGMLISWIFYQIFIFGRVMASPFANWTTDVPLDAITTTIEIDLKQLIGDPDVPAPGKPVDGVLW